MTPKCTFHLIGNAHLDPVWLWDWREGLSEGLITNQQRGAWAEPEQLRLVLLPAGCVARSLQIAADMRLASASPRASRCSSTATIQPGRWPSSQGSRPPAGGCSSPPTV